MTWKKGGRAGPHCNRIYEDTSYKLIGLECVQAFDDFSECQYILLLTLSFSEYFKSSLYINIHTYTGKPQVASGQRTDIT